MEKQVYDMEELYEVVNPENKDNPFVITRQCIQNATEYNTEHWSDLRMHEITKIINDEIEMDWNKNLPHFNKFQGEDRKEQIDYFLDECMINACTESLEQEFNIKVRSHDDKYYSLTREDWYDLGYDSMGLTNMEMMTAAQMLSEGLKPVFERIKENIEHDEKEWVIRDRENEAYWDELHELGKTWKLPETEA